MSEDRAQRDVERARDELRVAGEQEARPARQREDPLAHGHGREHAVHEVGRSPLHPAQSLNESDQSTWRTANSRAVSMNSRSGAELRVRLGK